MQPAKFKTEEWVFWRVPPPAGYSWHYTWYLKNLSKKTLATLPLTVLALWLASSNDSKKVVKCMSKSSKKINKNKTFVKWYGMARSTLTPKKLFSSLPERWSLTKRRAFFSTKADWSCYNRHIDVTTCPTLFNPAWLMYSHTEQRTHHFLPRDPLYFPYFFPRP